MPRTAYCAACGERKRLTFPAYEPIACTQRCAAVCFLVHAALVITVFCNDCGDHGCDGDCDEN